MNLFLRKPKSAQRKGLKNKSLVLLSFGYFSFRERAAVPPAKLDVFENKRFSAYPDDFFLFVRAAFFWLLFFPRKKSNIPLLLFYKSPLTVGGNYVIINKVKKERHL